MKSKKDGSPYIYKEGRLKGKPRLCRLCPTIIHPNHYRVRLCRYHLNEWEKQRTRRKRLNKAYRIASAAKALGPRIPEIGIVARRFGGSKARYEHYAASMVAARNHWRDIAINHPEKLPPGLTYHAITHPPVK